MYNTYPMDQSILPEKVIYIIESPKPDEILDGYFEGKALSEILEIEKIPYKYFLAIDHEMFMESFIRIFDHYNENYIKKGINSYIIVHLSCHSNNEELFFPNGKYMKWEKLSVFFEPINMLLKLGLKQTISTITLCLSSCHGINAYKSDIENGKSPFSILFGPSTDIFWNDSLIGYSVLYHNIFKKKLSARDLVRIMNTSINKPDLFKFYTSKDRITSNWIAFGKKLKERDR